MWGKVVLVSGGPSGERGTLRTPHGPVTLSPPPHVPVECSCGQTLPWPGCHCAPRRGFRAQLDAAAAVSIRLLSLGPSPCPTPAPPSQGFRLCWEGKADGPAQAAFPRAAMRSRFAEHRAPSIRDTWLFISPTGCPVPRFGTRCHASTMVWLSCWFYLVMKCFLGKEGANEARRALLSAGRFSSQRVSAMSWDRVRADKSGKEKANETRGVAPVTFPFVQVLQEWLELLLVEDCTLGVALPQHHPGLLQPGDLQGHGAGGGCWEHQGEQPDPGATVPSLAHNSVCCSQKQPPPRVLMARHGTSLALRLGLGFLTLPVPQDSNFPALQRP